MPFPRRAWPALFFSVLCACLGNSTVRRINSLAADGRWMSARELAEEALRQRPNDAALASTIAELDKRAEHQAANSDFDPKSYFYAQAYIEFFKRKRYLKAVEDMEQVLSYELDNEEMLRFMDKAQPKLDEEQRRATEKLDALIAEGVAAYKQRQYQEALQAAQRALVLAPSDVRAKKIASRAQEKLAEEAAAAAVKPAKKGSPLRPRAVAPAADPEWLQARYDESLKAYIKGDILTTRDILRELVSKAPTNAQYRAALDRIQKELPPDRR